MHPETGKAFIHQEDAYPHVVAFFRAHLDQYLKAFVQAGHRLPTGQERDILLYSWEMYYHGKMNLLASHDGNVNISASPQELLLYEKIVNTEQLKDLIKESPNLYTDFLKRRVTDKNAPPKIPVIRTPPDYARDSHIDNEDLVQWDTIWVSSEGIRPVDRGSFTNFATQFSKVVFERMPRESRKTLEFCELFLLKANAPHKAYFRRISALEVIDAPLMGAWRLPENRAKVVHVPIEKDGKTTEHRRNISNFIVEALDEAQSYQNNLKPTQQTINGKQASTSASPTLADLQQKFSRRS